MDVLNAENFTTQNVLMQENAIVKIKSDSKLTFLIVFNSVLFSIYIFDE